MSDSIVKEIYEKINELTNRERKLRAEIANIRYERARLKTQCGHNCMFRPLWISELPEKFWYPCYYTVKVISNLSPELNNHNVPPDLADWTKNSGIKEFMFNILLYVGMIFFILQLIVLIF